MKRRLSAILIALMLALLPLCANAQQTYQNHITEIYDLIAGEDGLQAWLDTEVSENAGSAMDNYVINLSHLPYELDFSAYAAVAEAAIQGENIKNPVSRMRCMLSLVFCGRKDVVSAEAVDACIGKLGVMSYIYGLHLLNNGIRSELWTIESLVEKLLSLQKQDGGWAVNGNFGDVDVTAMSIQALSVCEKTEAVQAAIDRGVEMLSQRQMENGGFSSYGRENAESAAQVIIALSGLGIDPANDERFAKNGRSAVDALLAYRKQAGEFAHLPDADSNETASLQALQAFTALCMNDSPYFDTSNNAVLNLEETASSPLCAWKLWALVCIGLLALIGIVHAVIRKHGRLKRVLFILLLSAIAAAAVCMINIESASDYYTVQNSGNADGEVYISIRCDLVAGRADDGSTPENGVILPRTAIAFSSGDSVFDVLTKAVKQHEIHMEHEGGQGDMAYVCGINYLYEYKYGDLSGWIYSVNGEQLSIGCGALDVHAGDEILWEYTLNIGEDLK